MKYAAMFVVLATAVACGSEDGGPGDGDGEATIWAVGTDFSTAGVLSRVDLPSLTVTQDAVVGVASTDPVVRSYGGLLYIVNRFGFDNVTIVDPASGQLVEQISTGNGTNPQDVAVKGDKLYVAALGSAGVVVLDTANPSAAPTTIDLSSYDTNDGIPDAGSVYLVGDTLFVTLQLLDDQFTSHGGKVVLIDTTDDTVVGDFDLTYHNPIGLLQPHGDELIVATTEDFGAGNGCVERIATGATPASAGCLIENGDLGGYPGAYRSGGASAWVTVNTSFTEAKLVAVDASGAISATATDAGQQPTDMTVCPTGHVVVGDTTGGGLRVYDADGAELTTEVLDIGQPPVFVNGLVCL